jgi:hypothetical protein
MTEAEWARRRAVGAMLGAIAGRRLSARKLRLLKCAFCRRFWSMAPECVRTMVELAERCADNRYTGARFAKGEIAAAVQTVRDRRPDSAGAEAWAAEDAGYLFHRGAEQAVAGAAVRAVTRDRRGLFSGRDRRREQAVQAHLVRDVFGNPFRSAAFDPRWGTADTLGLARAIYEDRAFDRLPLLADALMDAGCNDETMLSHCRSDGPHVRGCWVMDLVLGKE